MLVELDYEEMKASLSNELSDVELQYKAELVYKKKKLI